jgi:hypothetical protein
MRTKPLLCSATALLLITVPAIAAPAAGGQGANPGARMEAGAGAGAAGAPGRMTASGQANTNTTVRGAGDVLPRTSASDRGAQQGSSSSDRAPSAGASTTQQSATGAARTAATTDIRAGALVKDGKGATIGRIEDLQRDSSGALTGVVVGIGSERVTVPPASLSASGDFLVSTSDRDALLAR